MAHGASQGVQLLPEGHPVGAPQQALGVMAQLQPVDVPGRVPLRVRREGRDDDLEPVAHCRRHWAALVLDGTRARHGHREQRTLGPLGQQRLWR